MVLAVGKSMVGGHGLFGVNADVIIAKELELKLLQEHARTLNLTVEGMIV